MVKGSGIELNQSTETEMKYRIVLHESDQGYAASVPGLPGCWSQGETEKEALDNVRDAIREYLAVVEQKTAGYDVREIEDRYSEPAAPFGRRPLGPHSRNVPAE